MVSELLNYSGFDNILEQIPVIIRGQYEQEWKDASEDSLQSIAIQKLIESFNTELLKKDAQQALLRVMDPDKAGIVINWMNKPDILKLRMLESSLNEEIFESKLSESLSEDKNIPNDERIQLLIDYDETIEATERTVHIVINLYLGMIRTLNPFLSEEDKLPEDQVLQIVQFMYSDLYPTFLQNNLAVYAYVYKDISDHEMREYKSFYESEPGMWYIDSLSFVMNEVLAKAGQRAGLHME